MLSAVFRKGTTTGTLPHWTSRAPSLPARTYTNRQLMTVNRRNLNRYLVATRSATIHPTPKLSLSTESAPVFSRISAVRRTLHSQQPNSRSEGFITTLLQACHSDRFSKPRPSAASIELRIASRTARQHGPVLAMSWRTHGWQQQVAKFHSSRPSQMPLPILPAALFSLKTPVAALALRMVSRVSLTLLPLSVKRSPKVVLALVMTPPICFALVIFAGLEAAPNTGRWRFLFTSEEEELSMLQDELPVFMENIKVVKDEDDARVRLVKHILKNLLSSSIEQDGSTLRTGIVEKLEKKHEEAQRKLKEIQQQKAANEAINDDGTLQATNATSKRIVSTQMPVPSTVPGSGGAMADGEEEEEEDSDLKSITFEERPFQIFVAEDDAVNAFSLGPPRLIYINSGLLEWLENDEDLVAAVVAHELAHVIQRHTMETHGRETVMLFLADLLRSALWTVSIPLGPWFNSWVDKTTNNLLHFTASGPLHQAIEVEADTVSLTLLALAGYDPMHAVRLWEMWAEKDLKVMVEEDSVELHQWTDWMYDHPPSAERARYLKEAVMPAREMWEKVLKRRKDPMKRFLSLDKRLNAQVDEDGDLTEATVQDVMETMDELLKKQEEEERASGILGTLRGWAKWRPWATSEIEPNVVNA